MRHSSRRSICRSIISFTLERVPIGLNRKRALDSLFGRIFCGKPLKSAVADLSNIECRSRVNPRSVSTFPENAPMATPTASNLLTIGHSNLPADRIVALLKDAGVTAIADVRSVPFSRRWPWFSAKPLAERLMHEGVAYIALGDALGGRPRDPKFYCDGVADYEAMAARPEFRAGLDRLVDEMGRHRLCLL